MSNQVTDTVVDETTVYVMPGAGIGDTLDRAIEANPSARLVVVVGDRPGAGVTGARAFLADAGRWFQVDTPHVTRSVLRARMGAEGVRPVTVMRGEQWFGEGATPIAAAEAMRIVRGVTAEVGVRPSGWPSQTGCRVLAATWARLGQSWPECPADLADLLRETSGQGRFEVMPAGATGGERWAAVDARFQYGALAQRDLPTGVPTRMADLPHPYAPSWCEVEWVPEGDLPVGILPFKMGASWVWPTDGGPFRGWCTGAELHLARRYGYRVRVRSAIVWPEQGRPLRPFAGLLDRARDRIAGLPIEAETAELARGALRAILVQTVGKLHGRTGDGSSSVPIASAMRTEGDPFSRPEWTTALWGLGRARLAAVMLDQRAPVIGCALDGFYVGGEPVTANDDGKSGRWRVTSSGGEWAPVRTLPEMYAIGGVR